jgi:hypothetical protein
VDRAQKAFEFASDASKQMVALSTGIITLTVSLLKDVVGNAGGAGKWLQLAWVFHGLTVVFGLWFLLAITGSLGSSKVSDADLSIYGSNIKVPMFLQIISFLTGLIFTIVFGAGQFGGAPRPPIAADHSVAPGTSVTKVYSIGPFDAADTTLSHTTWIAVETAASDALKSRMQYARIDGILLLGAIDDRELSSAAAARFASNEALATARAQTVKEHLQRRLGDSTAIFTLPIGATEVGRTVQSMALRRDRRVDVYVLSHSSSPGSTTK